MNRETIEALRQIEKEKSIPFAILIEALEDALRSAYNKTTNAVPYSDVIIDQDTGEIHVFQLTFPPGQEPNLDVEEGEEVEIDYSIAEREEITPDDFGRIAAQTAKQVIYQRIREAEQDLFFREYSTRVGEIVTGIVQQSDNRYTLVDLGRVEGLLPKSEQVPTERYEHGMRLKAVIKDVEQNPKGPPIILSRRSDELIRRLFELEVPEIADGLVEIVGVAREPGYRSKISVVSHSDGVDPVGACVGPRGSRVRMVVSELRGEKIDIIPFNEEPARFVAKALSPARVREVFLDDQAREATVVVPDDQLALAIGKDGQNARLANRLTGWKVDIKSETEMAEEEQSFSVTEQDMDTMDGRCHALTGGGKRCPNAALPSSRYCGIAAHQALATEGHNDGE
jgi:N utilization substance protein A